MLFPSSQKNTTISSKLMGAKSNFYTFNSFKYSLSKHIFSHVELNCFSSLAKVYPTSANHRYNNLWGYKSPQTAAAPQSSDSENSHFATE